MFPNPQIYQSTPFITGAVLALHGFDGKIYLPLFLSLTSPTHVFGTNLLIAAQNRLEYSSGGKFGNIPEELSGRILY